MKWDKKLVAVAVAIIFGLSFILVPLASQVSPAQAAVTWVKSSTSVTLDSQKYVADAWVITDGTTYEMWYTHGKKDLSITEIIDGIKALNLSNLIDDVVVATEDVTLAGGASQLVVFSTAREVAGTYTVAIDSLSATFEVKALPPLRSNQLTGGLLVASLPA